MAIIAKNESSNFNTILAPEGNHVATCVRMIHVGTIENDYAGEKKWQNKVRLYFELSHERAVFDEEKGEENFMVSKEYTLSMHEKASLRKDLEAWRGKAFNEDEAKAFDITNLLGIPCMVNVIVKVHEPTGNKYTAISSITGIPKGLEKPERINDLFEFSVDDFDQSKFDDLSEYLQNKIKSSKEYNELVKMQNNTMMHEDEMAKQRIAETQESIDQAKDDNLPF